MKLVIDIGNSNIVFAFNNGNWESVKRIETNHEQSPVFYQSVLSNHMLEEGIPSQSISHVYISCVVTEVMEPIVEAMSGYLGLTPLVMEPDLYLHTDMHIPKPYEIGSDLVGNAYAYCKKMKGVGIVVDFGTALTFTVVNADDGIQGVTIAPGIKTAIKSLFLGTSMLPEVPVLMPTSAIGKNTQHAIQSGVMWGYLGLVKEVVNQIKAEYDMPVTVVATGGLCHAIPQLSEIIDHYDMNFTLEGIMMICDDYLAS